MDNNQKLFKNVTFGDLMEEIYLTSRSKRRQIDAMIQTLKDVISKKNTEGALTAMLPAIQDLLNVGIRNDEQLVRLATIYQRILVAEAKSDSLELSLEEREQIMADIEAVTSEAKDILDDPQIEDIKRKFDLEENDTDED